MPGSFLDNQAIFWYDAPISKTNYPMSTFLQFAVPFVTALLVLGIFQLVAYLHIQLTEADFEDETETKPSHA